MIGQNASICLAAAYITIVRIIKTIIYPGSRWNFGISGFIKSQCVALEVNISTPGLNSEGSSRVPARRPMMSGSISNFANNWEPHLGQNPRLTFLPLSAVDSMFLWNISNFNNIFSRPPGVPHPLVDGSYRERASASSTACAHLSSSAIFALGAP